MQAEAKEMIRLLRAYVCGQEEPLEEPADLERLYRIGTVHNVTPVLFHVLDRNLNYFNGKQGEKECERFLYDYLSALQYAACLEYSMGQIQEAMEQSGIEFMFVKGYGIRDAYPNPELRVMGDVDILTYPENLEAAERVLNRLGYQKAAEEGNVWKFINDEVVLELHFTLFCGSFWNQTDYQAYFEHYMDRGIRVEGRCERKLSPEDHFLLLCVHLAKHLYRSGAGVRMLLDLAVYLKRYGNEMDWNYIKEEIHKLQLETFLQCTLGLCDYWFHTETAKYLPEFSADTAIRAELLEQYGEYIISGGIFGMETASGVRMFRNHISAERPDESSFWIKIRAIRKLFFPERRQLEGQFPVLKEKPYLLGAVWIRRLLMKWPQRHAALIRFQNMDQNVETARIQRRLLKEIGL